MPALVYEWLERRLFEVLGGWVPSTPEPEVKLLLRRYSFQHAWHADLWASLGSGGGAAAAPALARLVDAVAAPVATTERLLGAYGVVLPALVSSYRRLAGNGVEEPIARALRLVLADEEPEGAEGLAALGRWEDHEEGRRHRAVLDELLPGTGL